MILSLKQNTVTKLPLSLIDSLTYSFLSAFTHSIVNSLTNLLTLWNISWSKNVTMLDMTGFCFRPKIMTEMDSRIFFSRQFCLKFNEFPDAEFWNSFLECKTTNTLTKMLNIYKVSWPLFEETVQDCNHLANHNTPIHHNYIPSCMF